MRVLIASDPGANPYVGSLITGLNEFRAVSSVMSGAILFWMQPRNTDVLHVQWPEVLFPGGRDPTDAELDRLDRQFVGWKERARVVATVHNRRPHLRKTERAQHLFTTVYQHCDAVIHLGERSVAAFREDYPQLTDVRHEVIPHGNYAYYENRISREEARSWLGIDPERFVVLAFGHMRVKEECQYLLRGFWRFKQRQKLLLVAGRIFWPYIRVVKLYQRLQRYLKLPLLVHDRFIPDIQVQYYLNAADVLVIPRLDQLNSGNVPLGFTFGKVVVGPRTGVIGELLHRYGNPTYDPHRPDSLAEALAAAVKLVPTGRGTQNRQIAAKEWDWSNIARKHLHLYQTMVGRQVKTPALTTAANEL